MAYIDMLLVAVCTQDGTWHSALQDQDTGKVLSPEACNLDTDIQRLEIQPQLPDHVMGIDLCARCWPTVTDRHRTDVG